MLTDLGSTNGTYVNRQRIPAHEAYLLHSGDRVAIGAAILVAQQVEVAEPPTPHRMRAAPEREERKKPSPALMIAGAAVLVIVLAGIVALLVILLQPKEEEITTPTPGDPVEQMMTVLPVPTQLEGIMGTVIPIIPTGLPLPFLQPKETTTPPPPGTNLLPSPPLIAGKDNEP
jgi:hypothetical protein